MKRNETVNDKDIEDELLNDLREYLIDNERFVRVCKKTERKSIGKQLAYK